MSRRTSTISADYFEALYAADPDPWRFATSDYEREKYAATLAALPRATYERGLEVGCSIGVMPGLVGRRCKAMLALDAAQGALNQARERCSQLPHITFAQARVPFDWPVADRHDLILLSEVVYYLERADVAVLADKVAAVAADAADVVLVHWLGLTDYPLTGDEAAECFISRLTGTARILHQSRGEQYRLDVLRVENARSGAGR